MKIVAILKRSAGNETVGEMWEETAICDDETQLWEVFKWAAGRLGMGNYENFQGNLTITIADDWNEIRDSVLAGKGVRKC